MGDRMATYEELFDIANTDSLLSNRIAVAVSIKATALVDGTPSAGQLVWATEALQNPRSKVKEVLHYILATDNAATVAQIEGASDSTIQTRCNSAVDALVS